MTTGAAVVGIVVALLAGYWWARWRRAETANRTARATASAGGRQVWRARVAMLIIGLVIFEILICPELSGQLIYG
jgi:hypothetical protein